MFMGFDNIISIAEGTSANDIYEKILSLTSDTTMIFTGGINSYMLKTMVKAMKENDSVKLAFDFSNTTGITEWKDWLNSSVELPKGVSLYLDGKKIKDTVIIPDSINAIRARAFINLTEITSIIIHKIARKL